MRPGTSYQEPCRRRRRRPLGSPTAARASCACTSRSRRTFSSAPSSGSGRRPRGAQHAAAGPRDETRGDAARRRRGGEEEVRCSACAADGGGAEGGRAATCARRAATTCARCSRTTTRWRRAAANGTACRWRTCATAAAARAAVPQPVARRAVQEALFAIADLSDTTCEGGGRTPRGLGTHRNFARRAGLQVGHTTRGPLGVVPSHKKTAAQQLRAAAAAQRTHRQPLASRNYIGGPHDVPSRPPPGARGGSDGVGDGAVAPCVRRGRRSARGGSRR